MKKIVRNGVFESNSSSSHSISIKNINDIDIARIPRNSEYCIHLEGAEIADSNEFMTLTYEFRSELAKAKYILNVIASYIYYYDESYQNFYYGCDNDMFDSFINHRLFVWYKEMLEEETGTEFAFDEPDDYYPYYDTVYPDDSRFEEIFTCDWNDEKSFKNFMKNLVFNDDIVVVDCDRAYAYYEEGSHVVF